MRARTAVSSVPVVCILVLVVCPIGFARTIRVANGGSADYRTIQAAIDASVNGDTVLVAPGTYTGDANRDIDFAGKTITVRSETGPASCIIQCGGRRALHVNGGRTPVVEAEYHRGFYLHSHEDANSVIQGFTITQGYVGPYSGGAVYCEDSSPIVKDCIIVGNVARSGGGIAAFGSNIQVKNCLIEENAASWTEYYDRGGGMALGGESQVLNCLIVGNTASGHGGGIYCSGSHQFINCTVSGNRTGDHGQGGGISLGLYDSDVSHLSNSIVWGNRAASVGNDVEFDGAAMLVEMRLHVSHSLMGTTPADIYDPHTRVSGEWLMTDPLFADDGYWDPNGTPDNPNDDFWVNGDYHLKSQAGRWNPNAGTWVQDDVTSPCIDAGDPNSSIGEEPFPNGGRINIGVYGGTAEASKSYFGEPVSETIIAGDINGDGKVDWLDLSILASHWLQTGE